MKALFSFELQIVLKKKKLFTLSHSKNKLEEKKRFSRQNVVLPPSPNYWDLLSEKKIQTSKPLSLVLADKTEDF